MKRLLLASLLAGVAFAASAQSVGTTVQPTVQDDIHSDVATRDVRDHQRSRVRAVTTTRPPPTCLEGPSHHRGNACAEGWGATSRRAGGQP